MPIASWLVATHYRPRLLRAALAHLRAQVYPPGWIPEIVVVHHEKDLDAPAVVAELGDAAVSIATSHPTGGGKISVALGASVGELVLVADDDDFQSPARAMAAIAAHEAGALVSEIREFRYLHLATGNVVRWCGGGSPGRPAVIAGTARNYRRSTLVRCGGFKAIPRLVQKDVQARMAARLGAAAKVRDLTTTEIAHTTICVQHADNIWDDRPILARGVEADRGRYKLVGEGHWSDLPSFPARVAELLELPRTP